MVTLMVSGFRGYNYHGYHVLYSKPKISSVTLKRTKDIEAEMQLKFSVSISTISVDGVQKNSMDQHKKTNETS